MVVVLPLSFLRVVVLLSRGAARPRVRAFREAWDTTDTTAKMLAKRAQAKKVLSDARARGLSVARETALLVRGAARATSDGPQRAPHDAQKKNAPAARRASAPPPNQADALLGIMCCGANGGARIQPAVPTYSYDEVSTYKGLSSLSRGVSSGVRSLLCQKEMK